MNDIAVELTEDEALAFAQFLKRVTWDQYAQSAADADEARLMIDAGERIRNALARAGFAPR